MLESPFIKVASLRFATLLKRDSNTQVSSYETCKIFKNIYFVEHLRTAASDVNESDDRENDDENYNESIEAVVRSCSSK